MTSAFIGLWAHLDPTLDRVFVCASWKEQGFGMDIYTEEHVLGRVSFRGVVASSKALETALKELIPLLTKLEDRCVYRLDRLGHLHLQGTRPSPSFTFSLVG